MLPKTAGANMVFDGKHRDCGVTIMACRGDHLRAYSLFAQMRGGFSF